jgi:hypothetical protein
VNLDGQFFNQVVVFVIAHVEMLAVFCQHEVAPDLIAARPHIYWAAGLFG